MQQPRTIRVQAFTFQQRLRTCVDLPTKHDGQESAVIDTVKRWLCNKFSTWIRPDHWPIDLDEHTNVKVPISPRCEETKAEPHEFQKKKLFCWFQKLKIALQQQSKQPINQLKQLMKICNKLAIITINWWKDELWSSR